MADIFTAKCEECGNIFSANFGIYRKTCKNMDNRIIEEYGEKTYSQCIEILEKVEKEIKFDIEDYDCFEIERVHDLDYNKCFVINRKIFENRLFICPECGKMDNKYYLGIFMSDCEYALKTKCPKCNAGMTSYKSFESAIEENALRCPKCGSNKLIVEHALHLD